MFDWVDVTVSLPGVLWFYLAVLGLALLFAAAGAGVVLTINAVGNRKAVWQKCHQFLSHFTAAKAQNGSRPSLPANGVIVVAEEVK